MSTATAAVNHWPENKCAKAFWSQHDLPAYHWLLRDTAAWFNPRPGERWIDLGCGCGQLTQALWEKSRGSLSEVVALDVAPANADVIDRLRSQVEPPALSDQIVFRCADFSHGLVHYPEDSFDGVISGLAIQYAEHWDEARGCWTDAAYDALLADICRVIRPGGSFVFSVNVPNPSWLTVGLTGMPAFFFNRNPLRFLKNSWRMMHYGSWLKREARRGRFHYLAWEQLTAKLQDAGFAEIEHRVSYVGQAYIFRCRKPV